MIQPLPSTSFAPVDRFGPWALDLDPAERLTRLHSMWAIVRLSTGPRGEALADLLLKSERNLDALKPLAQALNRLASIGRRSALQPAALHRVECHQ